MTLWDQLRPIVLHNESAEQIFHNVYSSDALLLCLRVTFAKWIEDSILKICPVNFVRGLQFQVIKKLGNLHGTGSSANLDAFSSRLSKCKYLLSEMSSEEVEGLHSRFMKCFNGELKLVQNLDFHVSLEGSTIATRVSSDDDDGDSASHHLVVNEIKHKVAQCQSNFCGILARWYQEKEHLGEHVACMGVHIRLFQDWYLQYCRAMQGEVMPHEIVGTDPPLEYPAEILAGEMISLFSAEGAEILSLKTNIQNKFQEVVAACSVLVKEIEAFSDCHQRMQQVTANGFQISPSIVDLKQLRQLCEQGLAFIADMKILVQKANETFDVERIRQTNEQSIQIQCAHLLHPTAYETNFSMIKTELEKLELSLYQRMSLIVDHQPEQVIKTDRKNLVSVRLLNFHNHLSQPVPLKVYLLNEVQAREMRTYGVLPNNIETVGTFSQSDIVAGMEFPGRRKRQASRKQRCNPSLLETAPSPHIGSQQPSHHEIGHNNEFVVDNNVHAATISGVRHPPTMPYSTSTSSKSRSNSYLQTQPMEMSPDRSFFHVTVPLSIKTVTRKRMGRSAMENCENVTKEKFCYLFVAELPINGVTVKVWTISLPMIVTTHGSHNEGGWATIGWDNVFPKPGRRGFEVEQTAHWSQVSEMLKGLFKTWVGVPLKPSHVKYIKGKVQSLTGSSFPHAISRKLLFEEKMAGCSFSFWCWFYRAAMIARGHFKEPYANGFIEGFIGFQEASDLLLRTNTKPGTFMIRFSDSEAGSLSLVFVGTDGETYRLQPLEVYKKTSFEDCCGSFLEKLNAKLHHKGKFVFRRVYPNICKKVAFKKFYDHPQSSGQSKPHYVFVVGIIPADKNSQDTNDSGEDTGDEVRTEVVQNPQESIGTVGPDSVAAELVDQGSQQSRTSESSPEDRNHGLQELIQDLINYELVVSRGSQAVVESLVS